MSAVSMSGISQLQAIVESVVPNEINVKAPDGAFVPVRRPDELMYNGGDEDARPRWEGVRVIPPDMEEEFLNMMSYDLYYHYDPKNWRAIPNQGSYYYAYEKHGFKLIGDIWVNAKNYKVIEHAENVMNYKPCACVIL